MGKLFVVVAPMTVHFKQPSMRQFVQKRVFSVFGTPMRISSEMMRLISHCLLLVVALEEEGAAALTFDLFTVRQWRQKILHLLG